MQTQWSQGYKIFVIVALAFAVGLLLVPFVFPLALGAVLSVVVYPIYKRMLNKKLNKFLASTITVGMFLLLFLIPSGLLIYHGATSTVKFFSNTIGNEEWQKNFDNQQQQNIQHLQDLTQRISDETGIDIPPAQGLITKVVSNVSDWVVGFFSHFLTQLPDFIISLVLAILAIFFAMIYSDKIKRTIIEKSFLRKDNALHLLKNIMSSCRGVIISSVVVGVIQATSMGAVAHFTHLGNFFIIWFITFILSFVPVVGSIPVTLALMGYGVLTGHSGAGLAVLIVGSFAGIIDNIVRPILLSGAVEIHPLLSLLAIMGGIYWMGLPGLIIGPLILAIAVSCIPIYYEDYKETARSRRS